MLTDKQTNNDNYITSSLGEVTTIEIHYNAVNDASIGANLLANLRI